MLMGRDGIAHQFQSVHTLLQRNAMNPRTTGRNFLPARCAAGRVVHPIGRSTIHHVGVGPTLRDDPTCRAPG